MTGIAGAWARAAAAAASAGSQIEAVLPRRPVLGLIPGP
jgi:hypothetical protein